MIKNYNIDHLGIIHQEAREPFVYDQNYVNTGYGNLRNDQMAHLRLGYIIGAIGRIPTSILDVGYGTGDFLMLCKRSINQCHGNDLFTDLLPNGCKFVDDITAEHYDVITFFDSLEHYPDVNFVKNLKCEYVVVSVPWCHNFNDEWFENWKHRKPGEHLHHFNEVSLRNFMQEQGFELITFSNVEDIIRKSNTEHANILTAIFQKKH